MWLGEQITERGIGNGISLIIFINIIGRMPNDIARLFESFRAGQLNLFATLAALALLVGVIAFVVMLTQATRKIPVQYAKRMVGRRMYGGASTHIPLKVNTAGVIPIIFASSFMILPATVAGFVPPDHWLQNIVRLFDPTSGEILLDGRPLPTITLRSLRSQIAIMTQDLHLLAGSLRETLTPPDRSAPDAAVWQVLELVAMAEFVRGLPHGLDTQLGEDGLNLSGGQRQRLSLARALLLDRPILLLDEPLANVDEISARLILAAIARVKQERTCLAITHEPMLLEHADQVYRLDDGVLRCETPQTLERPGLARQRA